MCKLPLTKIAMIWLVVYQLVSRCVNIKIKNNEHVRFL